MDLMQLIGKALIALLVAFPFCYELIRIFTRRKHPTKAELKETRYRSVSMPTVKHEVIKDWSEEKKLLHP